MSGTKLTNCASILLQERFLLHWCFILWILISISNDVNGIRAKRTSPLDGDTAIRTELIDRNNRTIWAMFNLTDAQVSRIIAGQKTDNKDPAALNRNSEYFRDVKEYRMNDIRSRLQTAFHVTSEESQEHQLNEMAAYPICNSESNESSWQHDNNVTIRFSGSIFESKQDNLNLDSAILRLYKINPTNNTDDPNLSSADAEVDTQKPKRCADSTMISPQIRVTVSIVQQLRRNKRERRKRICSTIMISETKTGWVEIDIRRAIYIWENIEHQQQSRQPQPILVGWLMIEVHDEEEQPLKPGLYFKPPKCDQADLAIPWNFYRRQTSMSPSSKSEVPSYPRLDLQLIGYTQIAPKNFNNDFYEKLRDSVHRQLYNLSKNSEELENESTTSITPTADNLIESSASTEIQQQHIHHKRHLGHYKHAHNSRSNNNNNDNNTSSSYQESVTQQQPHRTVSSEERADDSSQQLPHQQSQTHHRQHQHHHHRYRHQQLKLQHQLHLEAERQQHVDC